jgi:hypothetical protein
MIHNWTHIILMYYNAHTNIKYIGSFKSKVHNAHILLSWYCWRSSPMALAIPCLKLTIKAWLVACPYVDAWWVILGAVRRGKLNGAHDRAEVEEGSDMCEGGNTLEVEDILKVCRSKETRRPTSKEKTGPVAEGHEEPLRRNHSRMDRSWAVRFDGFFEMGWFWI